MKSVAPLSRVFLGKGLQNRDIVLIDLAATGVLISPPVLFMVNYGTSQRFVKAFGHHVCCTTLFSV